MNDIGVLRKELEEAPKGKKWKVINKYEKRVTNEAEANLWIEYLVQLLLSKDRYYSAALLLWGTALFDPRPLGVKKIIKALNQHALLLIQGAGSQGKSYTVIAWLLLRWMRDPEYTTIKIISTTAGHAKSQTFSTLVRFYREAIIPLPGKETQGFIGLDSTDKRSSISLVAIPQGEDGKGRLQGFHPVPRKVAHPVFGPASCVIAFLDEAEEVPEGVWEGVDNMKSNLDGPHSVKIIGAYNPKDITSKVAELAEPQKGWEMFDVEKDKYWMSKHGWGVLRLDGAACENVLQKKLVYPGQMTYAGFMSLYHKNEGNSPEYYTFGRGAYPPAGVSANVIPPEFLNRCRGNFIFTGKTIQVAGCDVAVDGRDRLVFTTGKYGLARGFRPFNGNEITFQRPKMCIEVEQQFELPKGDTLIVSSAIKNQCLMLGIAPEWLCLDRTGNAAPVHDYLKDTWSKDVQGIDFNKPASEKKILEEDSFNPLELYEGVVTEVWYAMRRFMEFGYIAFSPHLRSDDLRKELLGRKYLNTGRKTKVEKKDAYISRMGRSPDNADSLSCLVHGVRMNENHTAAITPRDKEESYRPAIHGAADTVSFMDFSQ